MPTGRIKKSALIAAGLLLLAGLYWALLLPRAEHSVFGSVPYLDEVIYLNQAARIGSGEAADQPLMMAPLYPYLIAAAGGGHSGADAGVYSPASLRGLRLLQISCWFGTAALLVVAGRWIGSRLAGSGPRRTILSWLPAVLFLLYAPAAVYAVSILAETVLTFLVLASLVAFTRSNSFRRGPSGLGAISWAIAAGLALGAAALLRGTVLTLLPLMCFMLWRDAAVRRRGGLAAAVLAAACLAVLLPAVVHNSRVSGKLSGPSFNGGLNLYIGNGPSANGFYVPAISGDLRKDPAGTGYWSGRLGRPVSIPEADLLWREAALKEMRSHPLRILALWSKKVWLNLQGWEIDQMVSLEAWRSAVPLLRLQFVPYGLLAALAMLGIWGFRGERRVRRLGLVLLFLVGGQSLFFVVSRYRQVLVPVLALLAAAGAAEVLRNPRRALPLLAAAVLAVIPWGQGSVRQVMECQGLANTAQRLSIRAAADGEAGDFARAEDMYRRSLAGHSSDYQPWLGLAVLLETQGRIDDAVEALDTGVEAAGEPLELEHFLVNLLIRHGRVPAGLERVRAALSRHPSDPELLHNAVFLLAETGDFAAAERRAREMMARHPEDGRGYADLGILMARQGREAEARAAFEAGLRAAPGDPNLERYLLQLGPAPR